MFKPGDVVECLIDEGMRIKGAQARVLRIDQDYVQVEFFKAMMGHSCSGLGKKGHCWNIFPKNLRLILRKTTKGLVQDKINYLWNKQSYVTKKNSSKKPSKKKHVLYPEWYTV